MLSTGARGTHRRLGLREGAAGGPLARIHFVIARGTGGGGGGLGSPRPRRRRPRVRRPRRAARAPGSTPRSSCRRRRRRQILVAVVVSAARRRGLASRRASSRARRRRHKNTVGAVQSCADAVAACSRRGGAGAASSSGASVVDAPGSGASQRARRVPTFISQNQRSGRRSTSTWGGSRRQVPQRSHCAHLTLCGSPRLPRRSGLTILRRRRRRHLVRTGTAPRPVNTRGVGRTGAATSPVATNIWVFSWRVVLVVKRRVGGGPRLR